jgi:hypothetical protein
VAPEVALLLKFVEPLVKVAVRLSPTNVVNVSGQLPVPEDSVMLQLVPAGEALTVTDPVGVPAPGATGATMTVTVTGCPTVAGDGDTKLMEVVVLAGVIVKFAAL